MRLFENGRELGPGHCAHDNIRTYGKGQFSHWNDTLYFSSSDNTDPRRNGRAYSIRMGTAHDAETTVPAEPDRVFTFAPMGGHSWVASVAHMAEEGDSCQAGSQSRLVLFEDGEPLGPAHAPHDDIRVLGQGRFSHWGPNLVFSTSDNSDPTRNGRVYTVEIRDKP
ncbi:MAG: hypothetical protein K2X44_09990, partial [Magnetospirillum sp.]|nr:hypothetical protein [Magnetospirillum sp.]